MTLLRTIAITGTLEIKQTLIQIGVTLPLALLAWPRYRDCFYVVLKRAMSKDGPPILRNQRAIFL